MKNILKVSLITTMLATSINSVLASGIPTVDGAMIGQTQMNQIQTWIQEAQRWAEKLQQFEKQYTTQLDQLNSVKGVANVFGFNSQISSILSNVGNLDDWLNRSDDILTYGTDILSDKLKKLFDEYGVADSCKGFVASKRKICEGEIIIDVVKKEKTKQKIKQIKQYSNDVQQAIKKAQKATTIKEAQDAQNEIQGIIAVMTANSLMFDIEEQEEERSRRLSEQKQKSEFIKQTRTRLEKNLAGATDNTTRKHIQKALNELE